VSQQPKLLITQEKICQAVVKLAAEIRLDYKDRHPLLIGILKGSFVFLADLVRELDMPVEVDFVKLSSYGTSTMTSGKVKIVHGLKSLVKGRDVIVVEDIVDTGLTVSFIMDYLRKKKPASLKLCALVDKPSRRKVPVNIDYLGFTIPDKFVVGYGIDWNERYRHLRDIGFID
jgi:hypoxanthine phosphoribosyltransferase